MNTGSQGPAYDRQLLLEGAKRNAVLNLTEVQRYGIESWGDPDYICIYGLRPADWYGRGYGFWGEPRSNVPAMSWPTISGETSPPLPSPFH